MTLDLPADLVEEIERHLAADWDRLDPSGAGARNALVQIGKRVAALYAAASRSYPAAQQAAALGRADAPRAKSQADFDVSDEASTIVDPLPDVPEAVSTAISLEDYWARIDAAVHVSISPCPSWIPVPGEDFEAQTGSTGDRWYRMRRVGGDGETWKAVPLEPFPLDPSGSGVPPRYAALTRVRRTSIEYPLQPLAAFESSTATQAPNLTGLDPDPYSGLVEYAGAVGPVRAEALARISQADRALGFELGLRELRHPRPDVRRAAIAAIEFGAETSPDLRAAAAVVLATHHDPSDALQRYARQVLARLARGR